MNNYLLSFALCLTVLTHLAGDQNVLPDINEAQCVYEGLLVYVYRSHINRDDMLSLITACMQRSSTVFGVHAWPISDELVIRATILDLSLISLRCQEKILTSILTECHQATEHEQEYYQYEREGILVDALRTAGVEQQLTNGEISHYADIMLERMGVNKLIEMCATS